MAAQMVAKLGEPMVGWKVGATVALMVAAWGDVMAGKTAASMGASLAERRVATMAV